MSTITDVSLHGIVDHIVNRPKGGVSITPNYSCLKDLDALVNDMYAIRDGSSNGCGSHGGDSQGNNLPSTTCSGHSNVYNPNYSLGHYRDVFQAMTKCSCDSVSVSGCYCVGNCTCDCNSDCCVGDCCVGNCSNTP